MYVIVRNDGMYVAKPGRECSYTKMLENARIFRIRDKAERERCGNETVRSVESILTPDD